MHLLLRVWRDQPGQYFMVSSKSRSGKWKDKFFERSQLNKVDAYVRANLDKDLYWCPHGFVRPDKKKEAAALPRMLWADLDEVDPRKMTVRPSVAWESSPGRYAALWFLDKTMTEDLNQRLTYTSGADRGGWDLTQVLRIPGTTNYKYTSTPRVRLLWADGPGYTVAALDAMIPKVSWESHTAADAKAMDIYKKNEKRFTPFIRRELLKGKPKAGTRSEVLWRLGHEMLECGLTRDEAFELLRISPWNKFATRRNGDEQLRRELDKALNQHLRRPTFAMSEEEEEAYKFLTKSMAEVEEENIDWVWFPYLARGEVTILEGDPGLGKSYLAQMIGKAVCDGEVLPSPKRRPMPQGRVAYFDLENSPGSVTKKRLMWNGCKCPENFYQDTEPFSIDDEEKLGEVYEAIEHMRPALVVFDTVNTYIGRADTHKAADTQQAFKRFIDIARRFNCSVLVLRHLTKSGKEKAIYRGQGSIAFAGLARVVITVGVSPDEPDTRVFAVTKNNVAKHPKAFTFTIESLPDTLKDSDRSKFVWGDFVDLTADDIISMPDKKNGHAKRDDEGDVRRFLHEVLKDGPMEVAKVLRLAEARSINRNLLYRVAREDGIARERQKGGNTIWELPKSN